MSLLIIKKANIALKKFPKIKATLNNNKLCLVTKECSKPIVTLHNIQFSLTPGEEEINYGIELMMEYLEDNKELLHDYIKARKLAKEAVQPTAPQMSQVLIEGFAVSSLGVIKVNRAQSTIKVSDIPALIEAQSELNNYKQKHKQQKELVTEYKKSSRKYYSIIQAEATALNKLNRCA